MKFFNCIFLLIVMISPFSLFGQSDKQSVIFPKLSSNDTIRVAGYVDDGMMIPYIGIPQVTYIGVRKWNSDAERVAFNRLKYNVLKVMPYALYAKRRYAQLEYELASISSNKERRQLVKQCDKEIKDLFNREIKDLSITQGKILTKLIDREVGKSTYQIVRETRGGVSAFVYQSIARVVGHNLKASYNAQEERDIESILLNSPYYTNGVQNY
ncbi:DUF4294 domain-containing protein [Pedobacter flavus]|uniref:DUF4294 domain-containing protein n=1 Tax=Pedobacter flavus TaxID=3113906 RepID=A0ABU7GXZ2_9SPHI|nr:DUF4294 domain-containing protein [Pedobacter sp. VNH31]MEE1883830.1 DUF4294 domain-containing protein [Pedobacter sp. VNH31]